MCKKTVIMACSELKYASKMDIILVFYLTISVLLGDAK